MSFREIELDDCHKCDNCNGLGYITYYIFRDVYGVKMSFTDYMDGFSRNYSLFFEHEKNIECSKCVGRGLPSTAKFEKLELESVKES